jgi:hypothetical protein
MENIHFFSSHIIGVARLISRMLLCLLPARFLFNH